MNFLFRGSFFLYQKQKKYRYYNDNPGKSVIQLWMHFKVHLVTKDLVLSERKMQFCKTINKKPFLFEALLQFNELVLVSGAR